LDPNSAQNVSQSSICTVRPDLQLGLEAQKTLTHRTENANVWVTWKQAL